MQHGTKQPQDFWQRGIHWRMVRVAMEFVIAIAVSSLAMRCTQVLTKPDLAGLALGIPSAPLQNYLRLNAHRMCDISLVILEPQQGGPYIRKSFINLAPIFFHNLDINDEGKKMAHKLRTHKLFESRDNPGTTRRSTRGKSLYFLCFEANT